MCIYIYIYIYIRREGDREREREREREIAWQVARSRGGKGFDPNASILFSG